GGLVGGLKDKVCRDAREERRPTARRRARPRVDHGCVGRGGGTHLHRAAARQDGRDERTSTGALGEEGGCDGGVRGEGGLAGGDAATAASAPAAEGRTGSWCGRQRHCGPAAVARRATRPTLDPRRRAPRAASGP